MIVTLSRQFGSEGDAIAARVASALGLSLVDREHIYGAALAAGVPDDLLHRLMYEGQRTLARQILDTLGGAPGALISATAPPPLPLGGIFHPLLSPASISLEESVRTIGLVVKDIASRGNVLVLGQGGQVWLRDYEDACRVQIVAPFDQRVARVAAREGISLTAARRKVRANDLARSDYMARYHNVNWLDPLLYHLVLNTGQMSVGAAVSLIVQAAQIIGRAA